MKPYLKHFYVIFANIIDSLFFNINNSSIGNSLFNVLFIGYLFIYYA